MRDWPRGNGTIASHSESTGAGDVKGAGTTNCDYCFAGFFIAEDQAQVEILDMAVRSDVMINALDPRGLVSPLDIRTKGFDPQALAYKELSDTQESAVLDELADGTGGTFFHNNNDLAEGFRRVAASPEYSYVLAFSPQDLKNDGRFHKLKVTVNRGAKLTVQARKGYYAPKKKG
jgi:VWFA-related protein